MRPSIITKKYCLPNSGKHIDVEERESNQVNKHSCLNYFNDIATLDEHILCVYLTAAATLNETVLFIFCKIKINKYNIISKIG